MKKHILLLIFFCGFFTVSNAQQIVASDSTKISLLTCSPGPVAYEKFGHTAIRIVDEAKSIDLIANWGIFDFDKPGFYSKFVKGETYYTLGIYDTFSFLESYRSRNSQVTEQMLNLSKEEKQRLIDLILTNYQPENREYLYNFVFDNCATRPRDLILTLFQGSKINYPYIAESKTFREWIGGYAGTKSWLMFGIDLVFGKDADRLATRWETMFLPEILSKEFGSVQISKPETEPFSLVSSQDVLVPKIDKDTPSNFFTSPFFIFLLLLIGGIIITILENRRKRYYRVFDFILFIITGLAGLIIFYLMFFSIHPLVKSNFNILWCMPLNLIAAFFLWSKKAKNWMKYYMLLYALLIILVIIAAVIGVQTINIAFVPLMILLLVRMMHRVLDYKKYR